MCHPLTCLSPRPRSNLISLDLSSNAISGFLPNGSAPAPGVPGFMGVAFPILAWNLSRNRISGSLPQGFYLHSALLVSTDETLLARSTLAPLQLNAKLAEMQARKLQLEQDVDLCEKKLDRATKLIGECRHSLHTLDRRLAEQAGRRAELGA